ncbi:alginate export family protein [Granulicella sp. S156]|uniref:alginate export family protein n=1 Tax=Granulicella sp. S156 TaxID=1747224 RepID=UPI0020B17501|nr:alginate export family protein [Granulicella sp. S156]
MIWKKLMLRALLLVPGIVAVSAGAQTSVAPSSPVSITVLDRTRTDANQWYADPPYTTTYPYVEQLLRIGVAQKIKQFDWQLEMSQNTVFDVPTTSVSTVTAQGQLGLGGTYYAANSNTTPAAASFRQGFLRYHWNGPDKTLRLGRFEFFDGQETQPKDETLAWLQTNRIAQRLIGNFGFSNAQRSFDGLDSHYGQGSWDVTAMAGRVTQGVFNMNANPELNVDLQYLAYSKYDFGQHFLWRVFAIDYHDGRTGVAKTDNRALAVRQADHKNIRLGTYGADFLTTIPAGPGSIDVVFWGALQNGNWGALNQHAGAADVETGYRFTKVTSKPWLRGGFFRGSGDSNATDNQHNTFFQILPTPRIYARFPFYDLMNSRDEFIQVVDNPAKKLEIRSDMHFLQLTSNADLWYQGGGAYDNKVFGYTGRPAGGHSSFASVYDISSDYQMTHELALNLYYAHSFGKQVVKTDYPAGASANYGYLELVYRWGVKQRITATP